MPSYNEKFKLLPNNRPGCLVCHGFWKSSVFASACGQERSSSICLDPGKLLNLKMSAFVAYISWVIPRYSHCTCAVAAFWALVIYSACFSKINGVFIFYFCGFESFSHFQVYPSQLELTILVLQLTVSVQFL